MLLATINSSIIPHRTRHLPQDPSRPADAGEHELPTQDHGMPAGRLGQRPLARPFGAGPRKSAIHSSIQTQRNGSRALSGPRLLSNPQAARMERLWSPAGATSGKHRQISRPAKPRDQAKSVAVGCDWLPRASNGKEGSTVRVRQRALQKPRKPGFFFRVGLQDPQRAVGMEPFMELQVAYGFASKYECGPVSSTRG
jgi:hypothetical protein